ncbi:MAG: hypothetical protein AMJ92_04415 [candidate division Zixibacteria bacterium SM23_81]|nr:MAG: hypothetical protein AMJ92_04415 [candidate division Zixibacteria bacterium SM23_81]
MKKRLLLLRFLLPMWVGLTMIGCSDVNRCSDYTPPPIPSGVYTITGDGLVEVLWSEVRIEDLDGYKIYRSPREDGIYRRIGRSEDNYFVDQDVQNGVVYYYAVSSYDWDGNESDLSYETVHDTPRPEGFDLIIYDEDARAGVDFSGYYHHMIQSWDDPFVDLYLLWLNGRYCLASTDVEYQGAIYGTDVQYAGYVNSLDEIDWAPDGGWSVDIADTVRLYEDHAYLVWTWENNFAKFQVVHIGYDYVVIDWAFQVDEGNPELKTLPTSGNQQPPDLRAPRNVGSNYEIPITRPSREPKIENKEQGK